MKDKYHTKAEVQKEFVCASFFKIASCDKRLSCLIFFVSKKGKTECFLSFTADKLNSPNWVI